MQKMPKISDVIDKNGLYVCKKIGSSDLAGKYYMAGGTALALQLLHRRSYDLDFFTLTPSEKINARSIVEEMSRQFGQGKAAPVIIESGQVTLQVCGTKVTFLAYPFPLLEPLINGEKICEELKNIKLASLKEIALMKAYTLGRRAAYRDYIDIYYLLKTGKVDLKYIEEQGPRKFSMGEESAFNPRLFLEQLIYTADIEDADISLGMTFDKIKRDDIENYLKNALKEFLKEKALGASQ